VRAARPKASAKRPEPSSGRLDPGWRELFEQSLGLMCVHDLEGVLLAINPAAAGALGFAPEELIGRNLGEVLAPQVRDELPGYLARVGTQGRAEGTMRVRDRRGRTRVWIYRNSVRREEGRAPYVLGHAQDVTDLIEARSQRSESEELFRSTVQALDAGTVVHGKDGAIISWNPAAERILGLSGEQLSGRLSRDPRWKAIHEDGSDFPGESHPAMVSLRTGGACRDAVMGIEKPDGERIWISVNSQPLFRPGESVPSGAVASFTDITARKQAEEALSRSAELLRVLIENSSDLLAVLSRDGLVRLMSPSIQRILGLPPEEIVGRSIFEAVAPEDRQALEELLADPARSRPAPVELRFRGRRGALRVLETIARALPDSAGFEGWVVNARDVTERRELEEQVRHAQKMEAVGRLAGGIAHDFNNMLTAILGNAEIRLARDGEDVETVEIRDAALRAAALTRQLLNFSRPAAVKAEALDLSDLVRGLERMLRRVVGEDIRLETDLAGSLPPVRADRGRLEQALVNLVLNARDAMPEGGELRIRTATADRAEIRGRVPDFVPPGRYVRLSVRDTGRGVDLGIRHRIFEPFFTTKAPGRGTGLGLATVYATVRQAQGHVWVEGEPGEGADFQIVVPVLEGSSASTKAEPPPAAPAGAGESILVVEDDPAVLALTRKTLQGLGYQVVAEESPERALAHLSERAFDLVLSDVVMPGIDGGELAERARQRHPGQKFLFMSGYPGEALREKTSLHDDAALISKPFAPDELARQVRAALTGR
jgi:PAS domain S-box-containing protein